MNFIRVVTTDTEGTSVSRTEEGELQIKHGKIIYVLSGLAERITGHAHTARFVEELTDDQCLKISMCDDGGAHIFDAANFRKALLKVAQGIPL